MAARRLNMAAGEMYIVLFSEMSSNHTCACLEYGVASIQYVPHKVDKMA